MGRLGFPVIGGQTQRGIRQTADPTLYGATGSTPSDVDLVTQNLCETDRPCVTTENDFRRPMRFPPGIAMGPEYSAQAILRSSSATATKSSFSTLTISDILIRPCVRQLFLLRNISHGAADSADRFRLSPAFRRDSDENSLVCSVSPCRLMS